MGIEPTLEAWEAPVLPLNYTRGDAETTPSRTRGQSPRSRGGKNPARMARESDPECQCAHK